MCCSFFPPSQAFSPYLTTYLSEVADNRAREFHAIADTCLKRLRRVRKVGPRRLPPGSAEIQSIKVRARARCTMHHDACTVQ